MKAGITGDIGHQWAITTDGGLQQVVYSPWHPEVKLQERLKMFFPYVEKGNTALVQSQESVESGGGQWGTALWPRWGDSSREGWAGTVRVGSPQDHDIFHEKGG